MNRIVILFLACMTGLSFAQNAPALPNPNPSPESMVSIRFDKPFYVGGERVTFEVNNIGLGSVYLVTNPYYTISRNGKEVYRVAVRTPHVEILPGETQDISWSSAAPAGRYTVAFRFTTQLPRPNIRIRSYEISADFDVVKKTSDLVVRTTKSKFKTGEEVTFYALNGSNKTVYRDPSVVYHIDRKSGGRWSKIHSSIIFFANGIRMPGPVVLRKGDRERHTWHQIDLFWKPVSTGTYRARMEFEVGTLDGPTVTRTAQFKLVR